MKSLRILFWLLFLIIFSSSLLAESNFRLDLSLGYGYILNDTPKHIYDTKDNHLYTKYRPIISIEFYEHQMKLDYQSFGYEPTALTCEFSEELTGWIVKDISLKYGQTILGKMKLKLAGFAGAGLLIWERQYEKNYLRGNTTDYYPTLPLELELSYDLSQEIKFSSYLFSNFNLEAVIIGAGIAVYLKLI